MAIYQFAHFHFDENRGSLTLLTEGKNEASESTTAKDISDESHPSEDKKTEQVEVQLRNKVANLLAYLIKNNDRIISKEELLSELWQHGDYRENSLTQSIRELRAALGDNAKSPSFIKTYPQRGYQWIQDLISTESEVETASAVIKVEEQLNQDTQAEQVDKNTSIVNSTPEQSSENVTFSHSENQSNKTKKYYLVLLSGLILIMLAFLWTDNISETSNDELVVSSSTAVNSVLVLPFINATDKPSMAWLELGLADMLAVDLQRYDAMANNQLHITPPDTANAMLANAQIQWPALPVHIRSLLREHNISAAIFASVRLHKSQQVFDFQIIHANGKTQQGSISYPSLPGSLQSISQQLLHLLNVNRNHKTKYVETNPIASQALAQGMQALQQEGPVKAKKYFQATLLLEEINYWARAYSGRSSIALGQWQAAEIDFASIPSNVLVTDPSLDAFIHYWRAEIAYRKGDTELTSIVTTALDKAETASDAKQMARGYRLKAKIAWQQNDWSAHKVWLSKAQNLFSVNNELSIEADKLFYLGNPSNIGLEKSPDNNLQENQQRLLKALNFYQQLGNQSMVAASQFAIAQNYTFALTKRASALKSTIDLYTKLQQPYELAQVLNYAGFYKMQIHNGLEASNYFSQARAIAQKLGAKPLIEISDFYLAFAMLDQGLDQQSLGRHGKNEEKLHQAISYLKAFINSRPSLDLQASALVFLGWANTDLGLYDLALEQLKEAKALNTQLDMQTTLAYSSYSIMRIHLERGNYQAVIDMAEEVITTRLQATFLARAYFEAGQTEEAIKVLTEFKISHKELWQGEDEIRLGQYQSSLSGAQLTLTDEPKAHLVYCESDWVL